MHELRTNLLSKIETCDRALRWTEAESRRGWLGQRAAYVSILDYVEGHMIRDGLLDKATDPGDPPVPTTWDA